MPGNAFCISHPKKTSFNLRFFEQDDGFFELAGLVSWGFGCGRVDVPGVYVKVSSFIGWINQIISVNNL